MHSGGRVWNAKLEGNRLIRWIILVTLSLMGTAAIAEQRLYRETGEGWFIYVEDRSCVMYVDYEREGGARTTMRFSARTDENKVYFSVVSEEWEHLTGQIGAPAMLVLYFPELGEGLSGPGMVIRNPDSRMGYTANSFPVAELDRRLSSTSRLIVRVGLRNGPVEAVAAFSTPGAAAASMHLAQCTEENFPAGPVG